jgi:D-alanine-D-alanine ligase
MSGHIGYNCDELKVNMEQQILSKLKEKLKGKYIVLVEGDHSEENKLYTDIAPAEIRGILAIDKALSQLGFRFSRIKSTDIHLKEHLNCCDFAFIYAQGEYGEDGRLQGWLDYIGVDYPGPGVSASAICCDKLLFKHVMRSSGIMTADYDALDESISLAILKRKAEQIGYPVMMKERMGGSSLGITLIVDYAGLEKWFVDNTRKTTDHYIIEKYIKGQFATVGIIFLSQGYFILPVFSVETKNSFYDADAKIGKNGDTIKYKIDNFPERIIKKLKKAAWAAFCKSGCEGLGRIDFMVCDEDIYVLEINTVPGISHGGNFTQMFMSLGFTFEELILAIMNTAFLKKPEKQRDLV